MQGNSAAGLRLVKQWKRGAMICEGIATNGIAMEPLRGDWTCEGFAWRGNSAIRHETLRIRRASRRAAGKGDGSATRSDEKLGKVKAEHGEVAIRKAKEKLRPVRHRLYLTKLKRRSYERLRIHI